MMGQRGGSQDRLFYSFNLDEYVPRSHLLRGIDRVTATRMSFFLGIPALGGKMDPGADIGFKDAVRVEVQRRDPHLLEGEFLDESVVHPLHQLLDVLGGGEDALEILVHVLHERVHAALQRDRGPGILDGLRALGERLVEDGIVTELPDGLRLGRRLYVRQGDMRAWLDRMATEAAA